MPRACSPEPLTTANRNRRTAERAAPKPPRNKNKDETTTRAMSHRCPSLYFCRWRAYIRHGRRHYGALRVSIRSPPPTPPRQSTRHPSFVPAKPAVVQNGQRDIFIFYFFFSHTLSLETTLVVSRPPLTPRSLRNYNNIQVGIYHINFL